jgi:hypothetical protein
MYLISILDENVANQIAKNRLLTALNTTSKGG